MEDLYETSNTHPNWSIRFSNREDDKAKEIWKQADAVVLDVDGTLIKELTLYELVKYCGKQIEVSKFVKLSYANDFVETFSNCINILKPSISTISQFNDTVKWTFTPKAKEFVRYLLERGVHVYLVSGSLKSVIIPIAKILSIPIENVYSNSIKFSVDGEYQGLNEGFLTKSYGKAEVAHMLKKKHAYKSIINIGDGLSDLEAAIATDAFIGFGGNIERPTIKEQAMLYITDFGQLMSIGMDRKTPTITEEDSGSISSKKSEKSKSENTSIKSKGSRKSSASSNASKGKKHATKKAAPKKLPLIKEEAKTLEENKAETSKAADSIDTESADTTSSESKQNPNQDSGSSGSNTLRKGRIKLKPPRSSVTSSKLRPTKSKSSVQSKTTAKKRLSTPERAVARKDFGFNADDDSSVKTEEEIKQIRNKLKEKEEELNVREKVLNDREVAVKTRENFIADELFFIRRQSASRPVEKVDEKNIPKSQSQDILEYISKNKSGIEDAPSTASADAENQKLEETLKANKEKMKNILSNMASSKSPTRKLGDNISVSSKLSDKSGSSKAFDAKLSIKNSADEILKEITGKKVALIGKKMKVDTDSEKGSAGQGREKKVDNKYMRPKGNIQNMLLNKK